MDELRSARRRDIYRDGESTVDDQGRSTFSAEASHVANDDPFAAAFVILERIQECALPLIAGAILALALANVTPDWVGAGFSHFHASA